MSLPGMSFFENYTFGAATLRNLTNWIAGEELEPGTRPGDVQGRYNNQREAVRNEAGQIGFVGDFRSGIRSQEFFEEPLEVLRAKVDKIDLTAVDDLRAAWDEIGKRAETAQAQFSTRMQRATDESVWRGESARAVAQGVAQFLESATKASQAARLMAKKTEELATGLAPTKELVPQVPEHNTNWENTRRWIAGRGWRDNEEAYETALAEARRVLRTVYAPVLRETDNVPVIPKPYNPTSEPGGSDPGSGSTNPGTPGWNGTSTPSGSTGPASQQPGDPGPGEDQAAPDQQDTGQPSSQTPGDQTQQSTDPAGAGDSTNPAGTTPASATPTLPGSPGSPTTPGSPGLGSPGSGSPGSGYPGSPGAVPGAGSSVPGAPAAAQAATSSAAGRAAANGRAGMMGMPGMAGRGAQSDEEHTKGVPDYLINQENGEELIGTATRPKAVPPVIGE